MGLSINGAIVDVPGVSIVSPGSQPWAHLVEGKDCTPRKRWPQQVILHKTIADDPEHALPGVGPSGGCQNTAVFWQQSKRNAGAHIVTGEDGTAVCLADLVTSEVFHATVSNLYSVGIETRERVGGGVYRVSLDATVAIVLTACRALGIQLQIPRLAYNGHPLRRMLDGGHDVVGVLGHRDNTEQRGKWDPGELLFEMLRDHGAESFDFDGGEDIAAWKERQLALNAKGYQLVVDGIPGPATRGALRSDGYVDGIYALGRG